MGECRFVDGYCIVHPITRAARAVLCTHAAQELERRVDEQTTNVEELLGLAGLDKKRIANLESRLALADEEKRSIEDAWAMSVEVLEKRLAQAEAAVARMREAGENLVLDDYYCQQYPEEVAEWQAALSPDAGRAKE